MNTPEHKPAGSLLYSANCEYDCLAMLMETPEDSAVVPELADDVDFHNYTKEKRRKDARSKSDIR